MNSEDLITLGKQTIKYRKTLHPNKHIYYKKEKKRNQPHGLIAVMHAQEFQMVDSSALLCTLKSSIMINLNSYSYSYSSAFLGYTTHYIICNIFYLT